MNSESATMFLNHLTVLDHAYIDHNGNIVGGSFHPSFLVTGKVDSVEKVVIDFSTVKKDIKAIIDDCDNGFDHKLWIMADSKCDWLIDDDRIKIECNAASLDIPTSAVKMVEASNYGLKTVGDALARHVQIGLAVKHPGIEIEVVCYNSEEPHLMGGDKTHVDLFRYTHGLKDSTSWGCQNVAHGHLSFLQVIQDGLADQGKLPAVSKLIAEQLDRKVFINYENIIARDDDSVTIEYTTGRGRFWAKYKGLDNCIILDTETTIEFIVEFVAEEFGEFLAEQGATAILVSEGLSKGAFKQL